jgi:hypothetical protein
MHRDMYMLLFKLSSSIRRLAPPYNDVSYPVTSTWAPVAVPVLLVVQKSWKAFLASTL